MKDSSAHLINRTYDQAPAVFRVKSLPRTILGMAVLAALCAIPLTVPADQRPVLLSILSYLGLPYIFICAFNTWKNDGLLLQVDSTGIVARNLLGYPKRIPWEEIKQIQFSEVKVGHNVQRILKFKTSKKTWPIPEGNFTFQKVLDAIQSFPKGQQLASAASHETAPPKTALATTFQLIGRIRRSIQMVAFALCALLGLFLVSRSGPVEVQCQRQIGARPTCTVINHRLILPNKSTTFSEIDGIGRFTHTDNNVKMRFSHRFYLGRDGKIVTYLWTVFTKDELGKLADNNLLELQQTRNLRDYFHNPNQAEITVSHSPGPPWAGLFLTALGGIPLALAMRTRKLTA